MTNFDVLHGNACTSILWCSFVHLFPCEKEKGMHPPAQRAEHFFRGTRLLMAVRKNQILVARHFLA